MGLQRLSYIQEQIPRTYLSSPKTKNNLNDFTSNLWHQTLPTQLEGGHILVLTGGFKNHNNARWRR